MTMLLQITRLEIVQEFRVEYRVNSDHVPLRLEGNNQGEEEDVQEEEKRQQRTIMKWSEEDIALYQQRTEEEKEDARKIETSSEGKWQNLKRQVHSAMIKKQIKKKKWKLGQKMWWDKCYSKKNRLIKRTYEKWRRGKKMKSRYIEERKKWRGLCKKKERRYKEEEEAQLRSLKNENDVWQFLNRYVKTAVVSKKMYNVY